MQNPFDVLKQEIASELDEVKRAAIRQAQIMFHKFALRNSLAALRGLEPDNKIWAQMYSDSEAQGDGSG